MTGGFDDEDDDLLDTDFSKVRIDFSQAHFLDHTLWQCRRQHGGRRRHLQLRWTYQWQPKLASLTSCQVGRHRRVRAAKGERRFFICSNCLKPLPG